MGRSMNLLDRLRHGTESSDGSLDVGKNRRIDRLTQTSNSRTERAIHLNPSAACSPNSHKLKSKVFLKPFNIVLSFKLRAHGSKRKPIPEETQPQAPLRKHEETQTTETIGDEHLVPEPVSSHEYTTVNARVQSQGGQLPELVVAPVIDRGTKCETGTDQMRLVTELSTPKRSQLDLFRMDRCIPEESLSSDHESVEEDGDLKTSKTEEEVAREDFMLEQILTVFPNADQRAVCRLIREGQSIRQILSELNLTCEQSSISARIPPAASPTSGAPRHFECEIEIMVQQIKQIFPHADVDRSSVLY